MTHETVKHPAHYTAWPVEVIEIAGRLGFKLGNVVKYVLRCGFKGKAEDLAKAGQYLEFAMSELCPCHRYESREHVLLLHSIRRLRDHLKESADPLPLLQAAFLTVLESFAEARGEEQRKNALATMNGMIPLLTRAVNEKPDSGEPLTHSMGGGDSWLDKLWDW